MELVCTVCYLPMKVCPLRLRSTVWARSPERVAAQTLSPISLSQGTPRGLRAAAKPPTKDAVDTGPDLDHATPISTAASVTISINEERLI